MKTFKSIDFQNLLVLLASVFLSITIAAPVAVRAQKASSVVIHASDKGGGMSAAGNFGGELKAALEREKPCVEPLDDEDIKNAVDAERERELLEGKDPNAALAEIARLMGAGVFVSVSSMPGPNGTTMVSATAMDQRTGQVVGREFGDASNSRQMAENLVRQLGSSLADDCRPHWVGSVNYLASLKETKDTDDQGPMHAGWSKVKRHVSQTGDMATRITASLMPPKKGDGVNSPTARVTQRINFTSIKTQSIKGEIRCREPGRNPYDKGFSASYYERTTQIGQGTDVMPVFISIDDDGTYTISVNAPAGVLYTKFETRREESGCGDVPPDPKIDQVSMPDSQFTATSFEAAGKTSPKNKDHLTGSFTSPDGHTKITWNLRLVKPKGK